VARFALVGASNTLLNFLILNAMFYGFGQNKIVANIIATSCALVYSFFLNRRFVFAHTGHWRTAFIKFVGVTAIGTLLLNNAVYIYMLHVIDGAPSYFLAAVLAHIGLPFGADFVHINLSAVVATLFSMVWNYLGYRMVVFRKEPADA
jgi:putative flippase GtrA